MGIIELILLLLGAVGMVNIIIHAPIAEWFRNLVVEGFTLCGKPKLGQYLVKCPTCLGIWVGMFTTAMWYLGISWIMTPFAISFVCYLAGVYVLPLDE